MKINCLRLCVILGLLVLPLGMTSCSSSSTEVIEVPSDPDQMEEPDDSGDEPDSDPRSNVETLSGTIRDISSADLVAEMGVGWNLGNSFDVINRDKTFWGNPLPTKAMIDAVKQMGFGTLRIPVTWRFHQQETEPYEVESEYLDELKKIVNAGLQNEMHVIINVHHDNNWVLPTRSNEESVKPRLNSLWTQVAEHFKAYGDSLIFETLNEPRLEGSPQEWIGGTAEGREMINVYNKTAVDAIRATGGNNEKRHLMIPTYAAGTITAAMNDLTVPNNDPNVIISIHSYFPWSFAGQENGVAQWGTDQEKAALSLELDKIREKWLVQENRAVVLGEFGATNRNNLDDRIEYLDFYVRASYERGLLPVVWDDGGNFKLFNRALLSWDFPTLAETIVEASNAN